MISVDELLDLWSIDMRGRAYSDNTIANRRTVVRYMVKHTGAHPATVTRRELAAYLARPGVKPASRRVYLVTARSLFRWMVDEGFRDDDPTEKMPAVKVPRRRPRPFTRGQIEALLESGAYARTRAMILLGYYQGFRRSSIARVHGHDIDFEAGTIRTVAKGQRSYVFPLHPVVRDLALTMPRDDWWFPSTVRPGPVRPGTVSDLIADARRRAGINDPSLTAHSLRHSFGTHLIDSGTDVRVIQQLMGHESLSTTQIYTEVSDVLAREGIKNLESITIPKHSGRSAAGRRSPKVA